MITERKLLSLKPSTRLRKIGRLLAIAEETLRGGNEVDWRYISMLLRLANDQLGSAEEHFIEQESVETAVREINRVRHGILVRLGNDPSDWDFLPPWKTGMPEAGAVYAGNAGMRLYLEDIRAPFNVGAIFRTAAAFGVGEIVLSPGSASPGHPRAIRSAMGAIGVVPWRIASFAEIAGPGVFALETGGTSINDFVFPQEGIVVLGNEELGISPEVRRKAVAGICSIGLPGPKASLNVAVACGILLQYWNVFTG